MFKKVRNELTDLWKNRNKIWSLTKTELKMEFGESRLGLFWSLLEPAGIILIFAIIFPLIIGVDFYSWVLFFIAGFIPHRYLEQSIQETTESLVNNKSILNNISIKEEIVPIASSLSSTIKFFIECIIFFSIIFIAGVIPGKSILILPPIIIIHFMLNLGVGMHLSVTYIELRDLKHILNVFFQALLFLTPIIYRLNNIPENLRNIYLLNPISRLILLYQESLLSTLDGYVRYINIFENLFLLFIFSIGILIIGYMSFKRRKGQYIGEI